MLFINSVSVNGIVLVLLDYNLFSIFSLAVVFLTSNSMSVFPQMSDTTTIDQKTVVKEGENQQGC